jgi:hypothetical protein
LDERLRHVVGEGPQAHALTTAQHDGMEWNAGTARARTWMLCSRHREKTLLDLVGVCS